MKIGVISDIHSNLEALNAVLDDINYDELEYLICLGDVIGYGANPNEVCDRLRNLDNLICVKGNHDHALVSGNEDKLKPNARKAISWTLNELSDENFSFLKSLKQYEALELNGLHVFAVHGSPDDYLNEYIYENTDDDKLEKLLNETDAHTLLMGHTHKPFINELGLRIAANPGSVGQPRDEDRRASYIIMDITNKVLDIKRIPYNVDKAANKIKKSSLPNEFGERLYYGR